MNPLQIRNTLTYTFSKRLEVKPNEERKETDRFELFSATSTVCWAGCASARGGNIYHTSRVVAILEESEDCVRFETQNSHYHLSMSPFPLAAVSPLPVRLAACA